MLRPRPLPASRAEDKFKRKCWHSYGLVVTKQDEESQNSCAITETFGRLPKHTRAHKIPANFPKLTRPFRIGGLN